MTESIQISEVEPVSSTKTSGQSTAELDFWRFAAEQYGIWLDDEQWREVADLDDHVLIARRYFWRLSDPEIHELLCAVPPRDH
jgi:hypothetical protein